MVAAFRIPKRDMPVAHVTEAQRTKQAIALGKLVAAPNPLLGRIIEERLRFTGSKRLICHVQTLPNPAFIIALIIGPSSFAPHHSERMIATMPITSAGLVVYRATGRELEVILGRLGGPLWARREHWTIPKGIVEEGESELAAACREFSEETGWDVPSGTPLSLGEIRQRSGKRVVAWAIEGEVDPTTFSPGTFQMEWPRNSGKIGEFPELSEARWFDMPRARVAINAAQVPLLDRLADSTSP